MDDGVVGFDGKGSGASMRSRSSRAIAAGIGVAACVAVAAVRADVPIEEMGRSEVLAKPFRPHWIWAADYLMRRTSLVDLDRGAYLGMISAGYGAVEATFSRRRSEIYMAETFYSRGSRGERTDVVTIYDAASIAPIDEIVIPAKRAINALPSANVALSDDERFLAVFNSTPATSLTIVDLEARALAAEIPTPGCSLVYAAGPRRFGMLCGDGSMLSVRIDDRGLLAERARSARFFDPNADPVTEKGVRVGDRWIFVSFEGYAHAVDVSGETLVFEEPWSLLDADDRRDSWRVGGSQHLAVHQGLGWLYSLVHQGGPHTHKQAGTELWVYDLAARARVQRIELRNPGFSYLGMSLEFGRDWTWPGNRLYDWLLGVLPHPGIDHVQVTQDAEPLLITSGAFSGSLAVYDARSGEFLRRVFAGNTTTHLLQAPWGDTAP